MVPVIGVAGLSVDVADALAVKNELQSAADSAVVAAIGDGSIGYNAAMAMTSDGEVKPGESDAINVFHGQLPANHPYTLTALSSNVTRSGET